VQTLVFRSLTNASKHHRWHSLSKQVGTRKKKHKKLSSKIQNWWNGVYPNKPKSVKQRGNFQTKTFHKWHSQERQRTTEQTKFKFPKLTKWGLPQNSKRHGKFKTKPKRYIVVMIKTWEEKKKKRKRVCVLKPTFSGIRKANDEERKWENNERCFQRVAKTERPNKASRGRSSLLRVCLQLQNINPLCSLQWRKELERTKINKRIFLKVDFLLFIYFNQIKENILLLFFYFS